MLQNFNSLYRKENVRNISLKLGKVKIGKVPKILQMK